MINLKESAKDKLIRICIIIGCVSIVSVSFLFQDKKLDNKNFPLLATVIHLSNHVNDPPILAVYRYHNPKHYLILYKINRKNKHRFEAIKTIELDEKPKQLQSDKTSNGVWLLFVDGWTYYNENLQEEERENSLRVDDITSIPFKYDPNKKKVQLESNEQVIEFSALESDMLVDVYSLSKDKKLLLALFERDIKIIVIK